MDNIALQSNSNYNPLQLSIKMVNLIKIYEATRTPEELFKILKNFALIPEEKIALIVEIKWKYVQIKIVLMALNGDVEQNINHMKKHHINNVTHAKALEIKRFSGKLKDSEVEVILVCSKLLDLFICGYEDIK